MKLLTAQGVLFAVSVWKIMWATTLLPTNPGLLSEGVSVVYMNAMVFYATWCKAKMLSTAERYQKDIADLKVRNKFRMRFTDPKNPKNLEMMMREPDLLRKLQKMQALDDKLINLISKEYTEGMEHLNNTYETVKNLEDNDPVMVKQLMVPALTILALFKNYNILALTLHAMNEFLKLHIKKFDEDYDVVTGFQWGHGISGIMDIIATLLMMIPQKYTRKLDQAARTLF